jgi:predicted GNAT family N-acyltransferase
MFPQQGQREFSKKISTRHDLRDISRTYLLIDDEDDEQRILGYFTLAMKCLSFNETDMDPSVIELMNLNEGVAQAYLIGQLARADDATPGLGRLMLNHALETFSEGKSRFGCRMVRLDCRDELIDYYTSYGFQHIRKNHEKDLNQMAIFIWCHTIKEREHHSKKK